MNTSTQFFRREARLAAAVALVLGAGSLLAASPKPFDWDGLYYVESGPDAYRESALVLSASGQRIPEMPNDPGQPRDPGFYFGNTRYQFQSVAFSSNGVTFSTIEFDRTSFAFSGTLGHYHHKEFDVDLRRLQGTLTRHKDGKSVSKAEIVFGEALAE